MKEIIDVSGLDVNRGDYDERTGLHLAAANGQIEAAEYLISKGGADVNREDRFFRTPLESAVEAGHDKMIDFLVKHGGTISAARQGSHVHKILVAASSGDVDLLKKFHRAGMDLNIFDYDHRTALHLAAAEGRVECVKFLLEIGANPRAEDVFGNVPIMDALRLKHDKVIDLLKPFRSDVEIVHSFEKALGTSALLHHALPIVVRRGDFDLCEVWIPTKDETEFSLHDYWFANPSIYGSVLPFTNFKAGNMRGNNPDHILGKAWQKKGAVASPEITQKDIPGRYDQKGPIRSCVVVPVIHQNKIHALLQLYTVGRDLKARTDEELASFTRFVGRLMTAGVYASQGFQPEFDVPPGIPQDQPQRVFQHIVDVGMFNPVLAYHEIEYFYQMGLQSYYFSRRPVTEIAQHLLSYIASKRLAATLGSPEDIWMNEEDSPGNVMLIIPNEPKKVAAAERYLERVAATVPGHKSMSLEFYRSERPHLPGGTKKIAMYILRSEDYMTDPATCEEQNTDLNQIATAGFLKRDDVAKKRYQTILDEAVSSLSLVTKIFEPARDGSIPVMLAFNRGENNTLQIQNITQLAKQNDIKVRRKFIVQFANNMTVVSLYVDPAANPASIQKLINQFSMLQIIPTSRLTPLFLQSKLDSHQYAYASAVSRFVYYFINQRTEEYENLLQEFQNDKENLRRLKMMYTRLKTEAVSTARINDVVIKYQDIVVDLAEDFSNRTTKKWGPQGIPPNKALLDKINNAATALDQQVLTAMLDFNSSVLKTNIYKSQKSTVAFRLDTKFLEKLGDWPKVPFAIFFLLGSDFQGFHIRFKDVSRGGIRLIKSADMNRYNTNLETLFAENYGLAYTQNNKNKDIPEFGSKGTILLHPDSQSNGFMAFRKYASGVLDLLVPSDDVVDNYGREEFLFLGPDEGTADMMEWAAYYARDRSYKYWRAFTTGKPNTIGGIPHDKYGMTTRSVHRYVLGSLKKLGLQEEAVSKIQTGGPDGDLGSNEILLSKDKTKAVIDGAGVIFDPNGLNREELTRLAKARKMVNHFDVTKLGPGGFKVLTTEKTVTLPSGEVVENGLHFRNNFHFHPLATADMFVPCGGRPESVNLSNVKKLLDKDGKSRFKIIVEGANLFFTNDARAVMEQAGAVLYKDASSNKGGVTSSSMEVFAALSLSDAEFAEHMCVKNGVIPEFYKKYVKSVQDKIERLADLEFECIWKEHERDPKQFRYILTERVSEKINELADFVSASDSVWNNELIRKKVLLEACPDILVKLVGYDNMMARVPESYMKAIFSSSLASRYVYEYGVHASEFTFFEFMQRYTRVQS